MYLSGRGSYHRPDRCQSTCPSQVVGRSYLRWLWTTLKIQGFHPWGALETSSFSELYRPRASPTLWSGEVTIRPSSKITSGFVGRPLRLNMRASVCCPRLPGWRCSGLAWGVSCTCLGPESAERTDLQTHRIKNAIRCDSRSRKLKTARHSTFLRMSSQYCPNAIFTWLSHGPSWLTKLFERLDSVPVSQTPRQSSPVAKWVFS